MKSRMKKKLGTLNTTGKPQTYQRKIKLCVPGP
jgi:hypothetical protein